MQLQQLLQLDHETLKTYVAQQEQPLLKEMLNNIGNPNAQLREAITYQLFARLLEEQLLQPSTINFVAQHIVDEQLLLFNIGSATSNDVFTRTASALWLNLLMKLEQTNNFIENRVYSLMQQQAIQFLLKERDARGFVSEEQGWSDAVGMAAELCYTSIYDKRFEISQTAAMLQAVSKALWNDTVLTNNEDERFVKIIMALIQKGVDENLFIEWVEQVFDRLELYSYESGYTQQWFVARTNILQLMKTLYFHLKFSHQYEQLRATTSIFIQRWLKMS